MSLTALRQAAFTARRTFTVGSSELKRPDGSDATASERSHNDVAADGASVPLEQHWQKSIDAATD